MDTTTLAPTPSRTGTAWVLALGPAATVWFVAVHAVGAGWLTPAMVPAALGATLLMWSPLPVSLPAALLSEERNRALPHLRSPLQCLWRAAILVPWMATSPRSTVRAATWAHLAGFISAAVWVAHLVGS